MRPTAAEDGRSVMAEIVHGRPQAAAEIARFRPRPKMDGRPLRGSHVAGRGGRQTDGRSRDHARPVAAKIAIVRDRPRQKMDGRPRDAAGIVRGWPWRSLWSQEVR